MSGTSGWNSFRGAFVALGIVAGTAAGGRADTMTTLPIATVPAPSATVLGYNTSGSSIDPTGISGDADAFKITSVAGGTFLNPSYLSLGAFQAPTLADGQSLTFSNTPFHFTFQADTINGLSVVNNSAPNDTPIALGGVLNGTLSSNQSTLNATFGKTDPTSGMFTPYTATDTFKFKTGLYTNTLTLPNNPVAIVPFTTNNGMTTAQAFLANASLTSPVPEPSTLLLFAATAVGLGFRHRLRKAKVKADGC